MENSHTSGHVTASYHPSSPSFFRHSYDLALLHPPRLLPPMFHALRRSHHDVSPDCHIIALLPRLPHHVFHKPSATFQMSLCFFRSTIGPLGVLSYIVSRMSLVLRLRPAFWFLSHIVFSCAYNKGCRFSSVSFSICVAKVIFYPTLLVRRFRRI